MLKAEKRDKKQAKKKQMRVTGRSVFAIQAEMMKRANAIKYGTKGK